MSKKKSKLQIAQEEAQTAIQLTNQRIQVLGEHSRNLHDALVKIQGLFDEIRHAPSEQQQQLQELKEIRLKWKQQAEKIEEDYKTVSSKTLASGASGALAGVSIAALGPTAAMGVATTFGVASTGTAISALSGAAATNAALAWLGGGALAAGGGGMAAGEAFLAMAGPVGWTIAGAAIVVSSIFFFVNRSKNQRLQDIFSLISKRDVKRYELAIVEINERIRRINEEVPALWEACGIIKGFGTDYSKMTEKQQYMLGTYVNLMRAATQLLVNPILGLQPQYNWLDYDRFVAGHKIVTDLSDIDIELLSDTNRVLDIEGYTKYYTDALVSMANLLYGIELDGKDQDLLYKSFRKNDEFLKSMKMTKGEFSSSFLYLVCRLLKFKKDLG